MCPKDDSHLTLEFDDHFVIQPSITFSSPIDFTKNRLGESAKPVKQGFEYNSKNNTIWLDKESFLEKITESKSHEL
jgi:UDP-N-acetylglucosamine 4,6-dehydratase